MRGYVHKHLASVAMKIFLDLYFRMKYASKLILYSSVLLTNPGATRTFCGAAKEFCWCFRQHNQRVNLSKVIHLNSPELACLKWPRRFALCHFMFELLKNQSADTEANMIPQREPSGSKILEGPMFHLITVLCGAINREHWFRRIRRSLKSWPLLENLKMRHKFRSISV